MRINRTRAIHPTGTTRRTRTTALAAATAGLALALTACGGGSATAGGSTAGGSTATPGPDAKPVSSASAVASAVASPAATDGKTAAGAGTGGTGTPGTPVTPANAGSDDAADDSYAYRHPCPARSLTVKVTSPQGTPASVRVITVTNNGSTSCGLDYHPAVGFSAKGAALGIQATAPEGLGGAPAYPVRAGATAYAAVNLDPSGGNGPVADEINILADGSHMPNADGVSLPLAKPGSVVKPKVGLYRTNAGDSLKTL
ncbi:DUF4232 domain-containing protein [Streptomyces sp. NPDC051000]|uniref:DUF4232 domain-containing protein n=1 Tax=Streptomyces sp. NPDC051000 TaxID=3155520 RepID=UPI0033DA1508